MGGKRQANTLSALISNFDTVEKVIETSANSAGSALKENERYLDSIQGKIDQFNNALQSMWSSTLDSGLVKWVIGLGTELIKIVDTIGLIPSILTAILTYKLAVGAIKMFDLTSLGTYIGMLFTANSATEVQGLLINKTALAQKLLNSTLIQAQAARMGLTAADLAGYSVTQLLTLGVKGLAAGFKNLWIAMGPVGWTILAIVGAATAFTLIFNAVNKTTEELTEELNELKNELSDIQSDLNSVNSELETTNERMAELLAKDSLSFVEEEELKDLKALNDELERKKRLLEAEEEYKRKNVASKAAETMDSQMEDEAALTGWDYFGIATNFLYWGFAANKSRSTEEKLNEEIEGYQSLIDERKKLEEELEGLEPDSRAYEKRKKKLDKLDKEIRENEAFVNETFAAMSETLDGVEYGDGADEQLDKYYNSLYKSEIARGTIGAEADGISHIFSRPEHEDTAKAIDNWVEALKDGDKNAARAIENIIHNNEALVADINGMGLALDDAVNYFVQIGEEAKFSTLEGKIAEMQLATSKMQSLLSNLVSQDFTGLFDIETGEVSETAIAEYFQGTSEATRAEVARLVKDIKDGKISIDNALKQFEVFSIQSSLDIYITEVQTNFKDVFVELEDADGLINTFEELGKAIGSTADALKVFNKAEAEMAYSGRVSIQTALELMEYTDDYGSILEVVDGKLKLVDNAEEVLIQTRIDAIKTSAQASLEDATNAYEKAKLATATYKTALDTDMSAEVVAKAWEKVLAAGAGLWEGIKSLVTDESWTEAYNRGYNATLTNITGYEAVYDDSGLQALAEAEAEARSVMEAAEDRVNLANQLTPETLEAINDADDLDDVDDAKEKALDELMDKFQKAMDYWENRIGANQARYEQLQNEIDLLESRGKIVGKEYYAEQVKIEKERLDLLVKQRAEAKSYLNNFAEGSDEWWEVAHTLNDLEGEIDSVTSSVEDLSEAMRNVDVQIFEEIVNRFSQLSDELSNIRDILSSEDMFDEEGNWTKAGIAVLGTHLQDIEMYKKGLSEVEEELDYLLNGGGEDDYSGNEQAYYDRVKELTNQQHEYTKSIHDSEQSVVEMYESNVDAVEEYTDKLIESYHEYIDNVKEALDAERDLYEFKKNVKKQTKDIAALERRIASLSGSTNQSDIAERRRLEADLYGAREELDDTYYDHAKQVQQDALDAEAEAYEETMVRFVEGMRASLAEATTDMDSFLNSVTIAASMNADAVLEKYEETGLKLSPELTNPWVAAKNAVGEYGQEAIDLMNKWTQDGYWTDFTTKTGNQLSSPWTTGANAATAFETSVGAVMTNVVSNIEKNVQSASTKLSNLYQQILDTEKRAQNIDTGSGNGGDSGHYESTVPDYHYNEGTPTESAAQKRENARKAAQAYVDKKGFSEGDKARWGQDKNFLPLLQALIKAGGSINDLKGKVYVPKGNTVVAKRFAQTGLNIGSTTYTISEYRAKTKLDSKGNTYLKYTAHGKKDEWVKLNEGYSYELKNGKYKIDWHSFKPTYKFAKGTSGVIKDGLALTDEPQFGDELVLVPGKDGNLSFMRKGTGVVPADLTKKLFELAQIPTSDLMSKSMTAIVPNITKNDFKSEVHFDSLVHVDHCDQNTLKDLEKMMDNKINDFSKQMNYSLKKFAR